MISLESVIDLLKKEHLLKEIIFADSWQYSWPETINFSALSYDSRKVNADALFFCKGLNFKADYLYQAISNGCQWYVSEYLYPVADKAHGLIVTDIKKAMAIISMAFYGYPQTKLKVIAYTGTKGKTTAAYFCYTILNKATGGRTALLSTMETILDGRTKQKSLLTTPESLDLYRMMAIAVDNNMTHLVMEVSSQAYKTERVYGLAFDIGIFLNISPDHISDIEHPTFDDYFYCKRQLLLNSQQVILNADSDYYPLLLGMAEENAQTVLSYSQGNQSEGQVRFASKSGRVFQVEDTTGQLNISGTYQTQVVGDYNQGNALSAIMVAGLLGIDQTFMQAGVAETHVPGRMEVISLPNGLPIYIDYAHNYLSLKTLLRFVRQEHPTGRLVVVLGSTGGKAISRRQDFGRVLTEVADIAVLTSDDPNYEDPVDIIADIRQVMTDRVKVIVEIDRASAIKQAIDVCQANDVLVLAGKGADRYQVINGQRVSYPGDRMIVESLIEGGNIENDEKNKI